MMSSLLTPYQFLGAIYGGILVGIVYGVLSVLRLMRGARRVATVVCDVIFVLCAFVLCEITLLTVANGVVELHTLCGLALGFTLYLNSAHVLLHNMITKGAAPFHALFKRN